MRRDDAWVRLFVALVPPPEVLAELAAATAGLPADLPGVRWVPSRQWHLTLAFLGEVDDRTGARLVERLGRVARRHPPPALSLAGAGCFGGRVLWVGVAGERTALRGLAASVRAAARRCAILTEQRSYRPHLTLARGGPHTDLAPLVERLRGFAGCAWEARELRLVRSDLGAGPGGTARHEIASAWPLTGITHAR